MAVDKLSGLRDWSGSLEMKEKPALSARREPAHRLHIEDGCAAGCLRGISV